MGNIFAARPIDNNSEATKFKQRNISTPIAIDVMHQLAGGSSPPGPTIRILCCCDFNGLSSDFTNRSLRFVS